MGRGGNVWEWDESSFDLINSSGSSFRGGRGGRWYDNSSSMSSSYRFEYGIPSDGYLDVGFRVVTLSPSFPPAVPEATSMAIFGLGALGLAYRARTIKGDCIRATNMDSEIRSSKRLGKDVGFGELRRYKTLHECAESIRVERTCAVDGAMLGSNHPLFYCCAVSGTGSKGYVNRTGLAHSFPSILVRMR